MQEAVRACTHPLLAGQGLFVEFDELDLVDLLPHPHRAHRPRLHLRHLEEEGAVLCCDADQRLVVSVPLFYTAAKPFSCLVPTLFTAGAPYPTHFSERILSHLIYDISL